MPLTIYEDARGRRYFATETTRAVVHAGARLWWMAVVVAVLSAASTVVLDLSPGRAELARTLIGLPFFGALVVPLTWLAYRWLPCSCTIDDQGLQFRGRHAGRYPSRTLLGHSVRPVPTLPGYRWLELRFRSVRRHAGIVIPPSVPNDAVDDALEAFLANPRLQRPALRATAEPPR